MGLGSAIGARPRPACKGVDGFFAASERCVPNPLVSLRRGPFFAFAVLGTSSWPGLGLPWLLLAGLLAAIDRESALLQAHFPAGAGQRNPNELDDDPVVLCPCPGRRR